MVFFLGNLCHNHYTDDKTLKLATQVNINMNFWKNVALRNLYYFYHFWIETAFLVKNQPAKNNQPHFDYFLTTSYNFSQQNDLNSVHFRRLLFFLQFNFRLLVGIKLCTPFWRHVKHETHPPQTEIILL